MPSVKDKNMFKFTLSPEVYADRMTTKQQYKAIQRWLRQCRIVVIEQLTRFKADLMVYGYTVT